jgi:hypothetical protein
VAVGVGAGGAVVAAGYDDDAIRSWTKQIADHLSDLLDETVGGCYRGHRRNPKYDESHWWDEIKGFIERIRNEGASKRQMEKVLRESRFNEAQREEIRKALERAAKKMGEDPLPLPPGFLSGG